MTGQGGDTDNAGAAAPKSRDHLRLVSAVSAPVRVTALDSFSFAQVGGDLIIMHNDDRVSAAVALVEFTRLIMPALIMSAPRAVEAELNLRRFIPSEMGAFDFLSGHACDLLMESPPCALIAEQVRQARIEKPLFAQDRHQRGYPFGAVGTVTVNPKGNGG